MVHEWGMNRHEFKHTTQTHTHTTQTFHCCSLAQWMRQKSLSQSQNELNSASLQYLACHIVSVFIYCEYSCVCVGARIETMAFVAHDNMFAFDTVIAELCTTHGMLIFLGILWKWQFRMCRCEQQNSVRTTNITCIDITFYLSFSCSFTLPSFLTFISPCHVCSFISTSYCINIIHLRLIYARNYYLWCRIFATNLTSIHCMNKHNMLWIRSDFGVSIRKWLKRMATLDTTA